LKDRNPRIRKEAAKTLSVIAEEDTSREALKVLLTDYDPSVRHWTVMALAKAPQQDEAGLFITALSDYDPSARVGAVIALGKLKSVEAIPYLTELVRDYSLAVRTQLVTTFSEIDTEECVQPLVWLLRDPEISVRILAVEKLGNMKTKGVEEALVIAAGSADYNISSRAITSLDRIGSPQALEIAKKRLDDEHMDVKIASIEVIGNMGDQSDVPILKGLLSAESTRVRQEAQKALVAVNGRG